MRAAAIIVVILLGIACESSKEPVNSNPEIIIKHELSYVTRYGIPIRVNVIIDLPEYQYTTSLDTTVRFIDPDDTLVITYTLKKHDVNWIEPKDGVIPDSTIITWRYF